MSMGVFVLRGSLAVGNLWPIARQLCLCVTLFGHSLAVANRPPCQPPVTHIRCLHQRDSHPTFSLPYPFVSLFGHTLITMNQLLSLLLFLAITSWRLSAAIDLKIVNAQIAPDGFKRSSVLHFYMRTRLTFLPTTVAPCSPKVSSQDH